MNRKQRVSMIVRMLLFPLTRQPFSSQDLLLKRTQAYRSLVSSDSVYYRPKLKAYRQAHKALIRSLETEMKPDRLSELDQLLEMFYPEGKLLSHLYTAPAERLEGYYIQTLLRLATEFITLRDGKVSIKLWDSVNSSKNGREVFPHSSGLYKVELWSEISRVITPDVLIAGYFVQCGIRDPRYLKDLPDNIALSDTLLTRVNSKGVAETHLHLSAGMNYLSVWEAVTDPAALRTTPIKRKSSYQKHQVEEQRANRNLLVAGWLRLMIAKYLQASQAAKSFYDMPEYYTRLERAPTQKWLHLNKEEKERSSADVKSQTDADMEPEIRLEIEITLLQAILSDSAAAEAPTRLYDFLEQKNEQYLDILYTDYDVDPHETDLDVLIRGFYRPYKFLNTSAEILLLFFSLHHIMYFPKHTGFQRIFVCYLRIKNSYFNNKLQPTGISGLDFFRRYFASATTAALVRNGEDRKKIQLAYRSAFLNQLHCNCLRKLEVKISPPRLPESSTGGTIAICRLIARQLQELFSVYRGILTEFSVNGGQQLPTLGIVYHLIRSGVSRSPFNMCWAMNTQDGPQDLVSLQRREGVQFVDALQKLLHRVPFLSEYVVGLDVASEEVDTEPWVYAPVYRKARNRMNTIPIQLDCGRPIQNLGFTYHVGEDYYHIISGLRHIDEVLTYLGFKAGDRLGHGLALQVDMTEWIHNNEVVSLPVMEHMENLLWLWSLCSQKLDDFADYLPQLEKEIMELAQTIYYNTKGLTPQTLWTAYTRKFKPLDQQFCMQMERQYLCSSSEHAPPPSQRSFCSRSCQASGDSSCQFTHCDYVWDADKLLLTHYCPVYSHHYKSPYFSAIKPEKLPLLQAAQAYMRDKVQAAGIYVETNPTSNLIIGDIRGWADHPITHLNNHNLSEKPASSILISVNSDDPLLFNTNVENELALVYHTLVYRGVSREDVLAWMDKVRQYGMDSSFIRQVKPADVQIRELDAIKKSLDEIQGVDIMEQKGNLEWNSL